MVLYHLKSTSILCQHTLQLESELSLIPPGSSFVVPALSFFFVWTGMALRRGAVVFKSVTGSIIFIEERKTLNVPGGKVEDEELSHAAVREVEEEVGGWPPQISRKLSEGPFVDAGVTRYFIVVLSEEIFWSAVMFFSTVFGTRRESEKQKITAVRVLHVDALEQESVHREVEVVLASLRKQGTLFGEDCVFISPRNHSGHNDESFPVPDSHLSSAVAYSSLDPGSVEAAASVNVAANDPGEVTDTPGGASSIVASNDPGVADSTHVVDDNANGSNWQRGQGRPRRSYQCGICQQWFNSLRQCHECELWACKDCSWWCTGCPHKYNICRNCNNANEFLRQRGKVWGCYWCRWWWF